MKQCTKCKEFKELDQFSKDSKRKDGLQYNCKQCNKSYVEANKEIIAERQRLYREENFEKLSKNQQEWYRNNKERKLATNNAYKKKRRKEDPLFVLKENLSSRLNKAFKGLSKTRTTLDLLGCSIEEAKAHIEDQFQPGMSWDNYRYENWHIDHKVPLSSAKNKEELEKLCHYKNLQPLWTLDNILKGAKIIGVNL
jgi:DNA-nicking Smr family endonuclease